eukprot:jgi/Psemu1/16489/gm1.16489_g
MVAELNYDTASTVIDTWEALKRKQNYEATVGTLLFIKFFALVPDAKAIFGWSSETETTTTTDEDEFSRSPTFLEHAKHFVRFLNSAIDMLGPDLEMLTEIFLELGQRQRRRQQQQQQQQQTHHNSNDDEDNTNYSSSSNNNNTCYYGVKPEHVPLLGDALIETLRDILGPRVFDKHTTDCWSQVYGELAKDMMTGMVQT